MPVSTADARLSIDFGYEYETPSGEILTYQMKFMHTEAGPTVQISNAHYEPIVLPAVMFTEVAEFLVNQNVLKGAKPPVIGRQTNVAGLGLPQIARRAGHTVAATRPAPGEPIEVMLQGQDEPEEPVLSPEEIARREERRKAQDKAKAEKNKQTLKSHHRPAEE